MNKPALYSTKYWDVFLDEDQAYIGRCVVVLKRGCAELSKLTSDEWQELHQEIIKKLETALKKAFNATMFNWSCLMNNAYKSDEPKPQVHWHLRPRYKDNVKFAGIEFVDTEFAHHYDKTRKQVVSKEVLKEISEELIKFL